MSGVPEFNEWKKKHEDLARAFGDAWRDRDEAIADRDRYATLIEDLKFDREEALAQVEQWRRINEGREYIITSYRIGQPSYADKGMTMIDEAREELLKILARRARKNIKAKGSHSNGSTST